MKAFRRRSSSCRSVSNARSKLLTMAADLSVKDVSGMCGFEDPNYFAKVFRRVFGVSPTEFRTTGMYSSPGNQPDVRGHRVGR